MEHRGLEFASVFITNSLWITGTAINMQNYDYEYTKEIREHIGICKYMFGGKLF